MAYIKARFGGKAGWAKLQTPTGEHKSLIRYRLDQAGLKQRLAHTKIAGDGPTRSQGLIVCLRTGYVLAWPQHPCWFI